MSRAGLRIGEWVEDFFRAARWRACRMLALTYQFDASAFERTFGRMIDRGVRTDVVIGRAVTRASFSYHVWRARWPTTFHPKLLLLLGGDRVAAGLGSSNLTDPGLRENLEVWSFFSDREHRAILGGIREFLLELRRRAVIIPTHPVEEFVAALPIATRSPVLSTLDGPLIEAIVRRISSPITRIDIVSPLHGDPSRILRKLRLATSAKEVHLYTSAADLVQVEGVDKYWSLTRTSSGEDENQDDPGGPHVHTVHAKMYAFNRKSAVDLFWGSANLTASAWNSKNIELVIHSRIDAAEWRGLLRRDLPEGHKWKEEHPTRAPTREEKLVPEGWVLLHAEFERGRLRITANKSGRTKVVLRSRERSGRIVVYLNFLNFVARVPDASASRLGFGNATPPRQLEWRIGQQGGVIPVNMTDALDGNLTDDLANKLYLRYAGRPLPGHSSSRKGVFQESSPVGAESSDEEELVRSAHQGELDRMVLEWRAVANAIAVSSRGNPVLRRWRLIDALRKLNADAKNHPGRWPAHRKAFVAKLLNTWHE